MNINEDRGYFSDDDLYNSLYDQDVHLVLGGNLKAEVDKIEKITLEPDYDEIIFKLFSEMKEYTEAEGLDLLEFADLELFKKMMMFYRM